MVTQSLPPSKIVGDEKQSVRHARHFLRSDLNWLSPPSSLHSIGSRDFGRSIEASLTKVVEGEIKRLQLRKRDAAVVMSIAHYEQIIRMKEMYAALVERVQEQDIIEATDAYKALYQHITSAESKVATDDLLSATGDDLRASYQPGKTEIK